MNTNEVVADIETSWYVGYSGMRSYRILSAGADFSAASLLHSVKKLSCFSILQVTGVRAWERGYVRVKSLETEKKFKKNIKRSELSMYMYTETFEVSIHYFGFSHHT